MSTPAFALAPLRSPRRRRRRPALNRFPLQWHVPLADAAAAGARQVPGARRWWVVLAALAVFAAHGVGVWYGNRVSLITDVKPQKNTLALEIIRPPKVEPPAPPPPPPPRRT